MSLSNEERQAVVAYRLEKAGRAYEQAKGNVKLGYWEVTANRLYYAAYYAVSALLIANGHTARTHEGVIRVFGLNFIKAGVLDERFGKLYSRLFTLRLTGDYNDHYNLDADDVMPLIEPTGELIDAVSFETKKSLIP